MVKTVSRMPIPWGQHEKFPETVPLPSSPPPVLSLSFSPIPSLLVLLPPHSDCKLCNRMWSGTVPEGPRMLPVFVRSPVFFKIPEGMLFLPCSWTHLPTCCSRRGFPHPLLFVWLPSPVMQKWNRFGLDNFTKTLWFHSTPLSCQSFESKKIEHLDSRSGWSAQSSGRLRFEMSLSPVSARPCWPSPPRELSVPSPAPALLWWQTAALSTPTIGLGSRHTCSPAEDIPPASHPASSGKLPEHPSPGSGQRKAEGKPSKIKGLFSNYLVPSNKMVEIRPWNIKHKLWRYYP